MENQQHRLVARGCDVAVGMKNPTSGDLSVTLNSVVAAQGSHEFIFRGWEVKTPDGHAKSFLLVLYLLLSITVIGFSLRYTV